MKILLAHGNKKLLHVEIHVYLYQLCVKLFEVKKKMEKSAF